MMEEIRPADNDLHVCCHGTTKVTDANLQCHPNTSLGAAPDVVRVPARALRDVGVNAHGS